jgi:hypothetical protein
VNGQNGPAARLRLGILDALEESFDRDAPEASRVLIHDRNRRSQGRSHREVTEPDHDQARNA